MKPEIIPAILVKSRDEFLARLKAVEGAATAVHLDCMDGHFVPNQTWYEPGPVETDLGIELHLMVTDPMRVMNGWKRVPQLMRAIWHVEVPADHSAMINECRTLGWETGLALSPETPVTAVLPYLEQVDEILIMGVKPGWSGQELIPATIEKIRELKKHSSGVAVGFDGGVTAENIRDIVSAGADRVNALSAIFNAPDPREALRAILSSV